MEEITKIEIMMSVAMVFYALAIILGLKQKKWGLPRWVHVSAGCFGFFLDMWATWDMEQLREAGWEGFNSGGLLLGHTIVSLGAVILFITMVILGLRHKIAIHKKVVVYAFAPVWLVSYISGIVLVAIANDDTEILAQKTQVEKVIHQSPTNDTKLN